MCPKPPNGIPWRSTARPLLWRRWRAEGRGFRAWQLLLVGARFLAVSASPLHSGARAPPSRSLGPPLQLTPAVAAVRQRTPWAPRCGPPPGHLSAACCGVWERLAMASGLPAATNCGRNYSCCCRESGGDGGWYRHGHTAVATTGGGGGWGAAWTEGRVERSKW